MTTSTIDCQKEVMKWPPTEEQIQDIATSALNKSQDKDVHVLIYWDIDPSINDF